MRAREFTPRSLKNLRPFRVRLRLKQPGYTQQLDTTVMARNPEMARRILRNQYDDANVVMGTPREIR